MCSLFDPLRSVRVRASDRQGHCARFRRAFTRARDGDKAAAYQIANAYYGNWLDPSPPDAYYLWCSEAARLGHQGALVDVARLKIFGTGVRRNARAAVKLLLKAVESSDTQTQRDARVLLAACLLHGWGCAQRVRLGLKGLRREALRGSVAAAEILGEELYEGSVVRRNYAEAARWLAIGARANTPDAARRLAELYELGHGVRRSPKRAFSWMKRAAELGDPDAVHLLALYYQDGVGTRRNRAASRRWNKRSWDRYGAASSAFNLALLDWSAGARPSAMRWFRRAADAGHARSQRFLKTGDARVIHHYLP